MNANVTSIHEREPLSEVVEAPHNRLSWVGAFHGKRADEHERKLVLVTSRRGHGGSRPFQVVADDEERYWVKPLNNGQTPRICVTEQIVGRIGQLLGAPTCPVRTILIPDEYIGWKYYDNGERSLRLEAGIAHASQDVPAVQTQRLEDRARDNNAVRHVSILALYDLCWGSDDQWLTVPERDQEYWSHDHGHYFPGNVHWTAASLDTHIDEAHPLRDDGAGLSAEAIVEVSQRLTQLSMGGLVSCLAAIPTSWPVTDGELEAVGHFVLARAPRVADRLLELLGKPK